MKLKEDSNSLFLLNLRRNRPSKRLLRLFSGFTNHPCRAIDFLI
jgi:hypothetical protein